MMHDEVEGEITDAKGKSKASSINSGYNVLNNYIDTKAVSIEAPFLH